MERYIPFFLSRWKVEWNGMEWNAVFPTYALEVEGTQYVTRGMWNQTQEIHLEVETASELLMSPLGRKNYLFGLLHTQVYQFFINSVKGLKIFRNQE